MNKLQYKIYLYIIIIFFASVFIPAILFPKGIIGIDVLVINLLLIFLSLGFIHFFIYKYLYLSFNVFVQKLFLYSVIFCIPYVLLQYYLSYTFTPQSFPFAISGTDQYKYWDWAVSIEKALEGRHNWTFLEKINFSDRGFPFWIAFLFQTCGEFDLPIKMANVIFVGGTAVLLSYSMYIISGEDIVAKLTGIIYAFLPTAGYLSGLLLKEALMMFVMSLWLLSMLRFYKYKSFLWGSIFLLSILSLFCFRTFLGVLVITLTVFYFFHERTKYIFLLLCIGCVFYTNLDRNSPVMTEVERGYWGVQNQSFYMKNKSINIVENVGGIIVLLPLSPIMPVPSTLDIRSSFDLSKRAMLYRIHIELFRVVLSFFFYLGLLYIYKTRVGTKYIIIVMGAIAIVLINAYVGVLTYYRYQAPALLFMVPIISYGIYNYTNDFKRNSILFDLYILLAIIFVIIYNIYRVDITSVS